MNLIKLKDEDLKEFKKLMQDAFNTDMNQYMVKIKNKFYQIKILRKI